MKGFRAMQMTRIFFALCVGGAALAACGGGAVVQSTTLSACTSAVPPKMLWPAPSSNGIPYNHIEIWVGHPKNPTPPFSAPSLTAPAKPVVNGGPWSVPSPGPFPPGILPLPAGDTWWTSEIQSLSADTTYTVTITDTRCNHQFVLGRFTTE